ncbi:MAG TPA: FAD-binding oxidoreductase [Candidatus Bathyarchaeia archaeon]|nr:FAD-binding oxidoreductase [Candidatus Bathyarchaeia archaeon]
MGGLSIETVAGWGRHPVALGSVSRPERLRLPPDTLPVLPRGLGRSYGDAAVPATPGARVLETSRADRVLAFDEASGLVTCEAGLALDAVVRVFLPRGWFPPVTPGTRFVTIGGCVACDVHGKNHHRDGSFGGFVERLVVQVADGRLVECGPSRERELFLATVGGMGLTGLITEVTFRLRPVESAWMVVETEPVAGLAAMLDGLRAAARDWPYTVGWIDCLARGDALGRGILMRGRHATRAEAPASPPPEPRRLGVPLDAPEWLLRPTLMRLFNTAYYERRARRPGGAARTVPCQGFFYPLDAIGGWNRLYGRRGFLQYQCVIPRAAGAAPVAELLERVARAGAASFLAVIKDCGPEAEPYLSFPLEGTTLALDLAYRGAATEALVHELNAIVIAAGGRVYLAKDAVTRAEDWVRMVPHLPAWRRIRDRWDPERRFRSALSVRLLGDRA